MSRFQSKQPVKLHNRRLLNVSRLITSHNCDPTELACKHLSDSQESDLWCSLEVLTSFFRTVSLANGGFQNVRRRSQRAPSGLWTKFAMTWVSAPSFKIARSCMATGTRQIWPEGVTNTIVTQLWRAWNRWFTHDACTENRMSVNVRIFWEDGVCPSASSSSLYRITLTSGPNHVEVESLERFSHLSLTNKATLAMELDICFTPTHSRFYLRATCLSSSWKHYLVLVSFIQKVKCGTWNIVSELEMNTDFTLPM